MGNNTEETKKKGGKMWSVIGIIVIIAVVVGAFIGIKHTNQTTANPATTPADTTNLPAATPTATVPTDTSGPYKDGTYSAEGDYTSPGGAESIQVTLTLQNDIITDVGVTSDATRPNSVKYQGVFIANYRQYVIGQDISTLNLTKVSGSSLTPKGFDDALTKIKTEAQA